MSDYSISLDELKQQITKNQHINNEQELNDKIIEILLSKVKNGEIKFPYQKTFRQNPEILFSNLKKIDLQIHYSQNKFKLYSYYPQYNFYLAPKFRGSYVKIQGTKTAYDSADVLSDIFIEDVRMKAKRYDQEKSIAESWNDDNGVKKIMNAALKCDIINPENLRQAIYNSIAETKIFNPTWARALLKCVFQKNDLSNLKWLDISAGWGDRLLAAMSLNMYYLGYDPNLDLQLGHNTMISKFGDPLKHQVVAETFEQAQLPQQSFDVVLSSPPYFNLENYSPQATQSMNKYPTFNDWMVNFLYISLTKAWNSLKFGGYLILHLGDAQQIRIAEPANLFIDNYLFGSSWEGVIGLLGEAGYPRPVWVWKKVADPAHVKKWQPTSYQNRSLMLTYPFLYSNFFNSIISKHIPNYLKSLDDYRIFLEKLTTSTSLNLQPLIPKLFSPLLHHLIQKNNSTDILQISLDILSNQTYTAPDYFTVALSSLQPTKNSLYKMFNKLQQHDIDNVISDLLIYLCLELFGSEKSLDFIKHLLLLTYNNYIF